MKRKRRMKTMTVIKGSSYNPILCFFWCSSPIGWGSRAFRQIVGEVGAISKEQKTVVLPFITSCQCEHV